MATTKIGIRPYFIYSQFDKSIEMVLSVTCVINVSCARAYAIYGAFC
jgi:hypothetical protein